MFFKKEPETNKLKKSISIYISDRYKHLIMAPRYQKGLGLTFEQEKCFTAGYPMTPSKLRTEVINHLNLYSKKDIDLRDMKRTDWPAFKHSQSKSVKAFEQEYITIWVGSVSESNFSLEICGYPFTNCELTVNSTVSFFEEKETIGQLIDKVYYACLTGKVF